MNKRAREEQRDGLDRPETTPAALGVDTNAVGGPPPSSSSRRPSISRSAAVTIGAARARARDRRNSCPSGARPPVLVAADPAEVTACHRAGGTATRGVASPPPSRRQSTSSIKLPHGAGAGAAAAAARGAYPESRGNRRYVGALSETVDVIDEEDWLESGDPRSLLDKSSRDDKEEGDVVQRRDGVGNNPAMSASTAAASTSAQHRSPRVPHKLTDLPDNVLANAFFSGFLDTLHVASCVRLVSRRVMAIGSDARKILGIVNAIGTHLRGLINSALARWRMTVLMETVAESGKEEWSPAMDLHSLVISDADLSNIAKAFPNLQHIDLRFSKGLVGGLGESLKSCIHTLRTLSLRGAGASDAMVEGLGEFQELTSLDLSQSTSRDTKKITSEGLEELAGLRNLERLSLTWNKGVTDDFVRLLCANMDGLQELDLGLCEEITCSSLRALSTQRNLRVLSIRACRYVNDEGVEVVVSACPRLTSLDLAHLPLLTRQSLNFLLGLVDLRKLDLRCCEFISTLDVADFKAVRPRTIVEELQAWWP